MRRCGVLLAVAAMGFLGGCATSNDVDVNKLLKDLEAEMAAEGGPKIIGRDAPEPPSSGLPPLPAEEVRAVQAAVAAAAAELTIQPDCLLQVSVKEDRSLDGSYTVNEIGAVELGRVGPVIVYNMTEPQASAKIKEILEQRDFKQATVGVRIVKASYDKIMVAGAVNKGGVIKIGAGDTISLNDALLRAGGLRPTANRARVRLVRNGLKTVLAPELPGESYSLLDADGKPKIPDVRLRNNDVVYVFSTEIMGPAGVGEKDVLVLGEVTKKGYYRFAGGENCTMMNLLFKMGGLPMYANAKAIRVIRRGKDGKDTEIKVNANKILSEGNPEEDVPLENGDRVIVPARRFSLF